MADVYCLHAIKMLNHVFQEDALRDRADEILGRLTAGESLAAVLIDTGRQLRQFRRNPLLLGLERVVQNWPAAHLEVVRGTVIWALMQRRNGLPVRMVWKGDAEYPETVTRIELRGEEVQIEFAHPPAVAQRLTA